MSEPTDFQRGVLRGIELSTAEINSFRAYLVRQDKFDPGEKVFALLVLEFVTNTLNEKVLSGYKQLIMDKTENDTTERV